MPVADIEIINKLGLHARAASKLVAVTTKFSCTIVLAKAEKSSDGEELIKSEKSVDGKSILSVMMLAANKGSFLNVTTDGEDQDQALEAISTLINNKFDEDE